MAVVAIAVLAVIALLLVMRTAPARPVPSSTSTARSRLLSPANFRASGESTALTVALVALAVVMVLLVRVTVGVALGFLALSVALLKVRQGQLLGQGVKVGPGQLDRVNACAERAAEQLCMPMPDVFVVQAPTINAFALGFIGRKSVVLHSATVEALDDDELTFVIGHEFTHINAGHTQWLVLTSVGDTLRLPFIAGAIGFLLRGWSRRAEYTSDRGGLIACGSLRPAVSAMAKLAVGANLYEQLGTDALLRQKDAVDADIVSSVGELFGGHPYIVNRVSALHDFSRTPYFQRVSGDAAWT